MTDASAKLHRIRLELAREPGHPAGEPHIGYTFVAPLDGAGRIDADAWRSLHAFCVVNGFGRPDSGQGLLRRRPGGSWAFHYDIDGVADDDAGYRFDAHRFVVGEYVTIREDDADHTYRVAAVSPA